MSQSEQEGLPRKPPQTSSPLSLQLWAKAFQRVGEQHQDQQLLESARLLQLAALQKTPPPTTGSQSGNA